MYFCFCQLGSQRGKWMPPGKVQNSSIDVQSQASSSVSQVKKIPSNEPRKQLGIGRRDTRSTVKVQTRSVAFEKQLPW